MIKSFKVCAEQHGRVTDKKYLLVLRTRVKQINFFLRYLTIRLCLRSVEQIGSNISANMLPLSYWVKFVVIHVTIIFPYLIGKKHFGID